MSGGLIEYESLQAFYAADERRLRSPELDFGVWWRHRGVVYRLTWVEATGELIAVQLSPATAIPLHALSDELERVYVPREYAVAVAGIAIIGGEPGTVTVLDTVSGREAVERLLDGWAEVCGQPDSLGWVQKQLAGESGADEATS